jgi:hypothetical protein
LRIIATEKKQRKERWTIFDMIQPREQMLRAVQKPTPEQPKASGTTSEQEGSKQPQIPPARDLILGGRESLLLCTLPQTLWDL